VSFVKPDRYTVMIVYIYIVRRRNILVVCVCVCGVCVMLKVYHTSCSDKHSLQGISGYRRLPYIIRRKAILLLLLGEWLCIKRQRRVGVVKCAVERRRWTHKVVVVSLNIVHDRCRYSICVVIVLIRVTTN